MKKYKRGKRHIAWGRLLLLIFLAASIGGGIFAGITLLKNNPYEKYEVYQEDTKKTGTLQHETLTEEEAYFLSCYYPSFDIPKLDKLVSDYRKDLKSSIKKEKGMRYIMVDYDAEKLYDAYIVLRFRQKTVDENDKVLKEETTYYNYDTKKQKLMSVEDVLRRDYLPMMKQQAKKQGIKDEITKKALNTFVIGKKEVTFYFGKQKEKSIALPYEEHKRYIALTNEHIPSYYMHDPILPPAQPKIEKGKKLIAFTFDDGPHPKNTKIIMDELEKYNGRGTFFMLGKNAEAYPDIVKEVYQRGHEVANHSWDHSMRIAANRTDLMSKAEVSEEVYKPNDAVFKAAGYEPKYFRPPYGAIKQNLDAVCGLDMVMWDIDSEDWKNHDAEKMSSIIKKHALVGYEVVLMHDIHDDTVEGVKKILKELNQEGYQFVTIDTLLKEDAKYLLHFNEGRMNNVVIPSSLQ